MSQSPTAASPPIPWGGIHHIALVTPDLDATRAFYADVLGMQVGEVRVGGGV
jgi:catechol 2,3-dioxygenase-like lactoylglutathione lyase family enzyme